MLKQRRSGILLHPTSLPGPQPIGSLGQEAYAFVDFLVAARQTVWQILPLGPTGYGDCPYSCFSAFAGNPQLIDLRQLVLSGDLKEEDLPPAVTASDEADYPAAAELVVELLGLAFQNFRTSASTERRQLFQEFSQKQGFWLTDYALFETIRGEHDEHWQNWPAELRLLKDASTLAAFSREHRETIDWHCYLQFVFFEQWRALKSYANQRGILIFGDLPIFVAENSADVWANKEYYYLDENSRPTLIAGVPPDYFSSTGQRWGNPLYRWDKMAEDNFSWWRQRFRWNLELFDIVRVDHFRGFAACWAIAASEETAVNGYWMEVPGGALFEILKQDFTQLPIIAEDLGIITPDVESLRDGLQLPGMKILQFAFDSGGDNPYLPHQHIPNAVIYTGTHDNDTTRGWWNKLDDPARQRIRNYLMRPCHDMPWPFVETAFASVCKMAVIPLQDILSLGEESRMNTPGTAFNNWRWRALPKTMTPELAARLAHLSDMFNRNLCDSTEM